MLLLELLLDEFILSVLVLVLVLMFYFLMIRPAIKRKKQRKEMRSSLKKGGQITAPPAPETRSVPGEAGGVSCPNCGRAQGGGMRFCVYCGTQLPTQPAAAPTQKFCVHCGAKLPEGQIFCGECGMKVM